MEVMTDSYDNIMRDLGKPDDVVKKTICESHLSDFNVLGKYIFIICSF